MACHYCFGQNSNESIACGLNSIPRQAKLTVCVLGEEVATMARRELISLGDVRSRVRSRDCCSTSGTVPLSCCMCIS